MSILELLGITFFEGVSSAGLMIDTSMIITTNKTDVIINLKLYLEPLAAGINTLKHTFGSDTKTVCCFVFTQLTLGLY